MTQNVILEGILHRCHFAVAVANVHGRQLNKCIVSLPSDCFATAKNSFGFGTQLSVEQIKPVVKVGSG